MKSKKFTFALILAIAPMIWSPPAQATTPQDQFEKSMALTRQGKYAAALTHLKKAQQLYTQQGNPEGTFRSAALAYFIDFEKQTLETSGKNLPRDWMRGGWLLKDFNYSGTYIIPPVPSNSYHGLLILTRKVRDIKQGPGRSTPLWGILAVQSIPNLKPGEEFSGGNCQLKGKPHDPEIAAIMMTKGQENQEKFTKIQKAWRLNIRTGKIQEIPSNSVVCINEGFGV